MAHGWIFILPIAQKSFIKLHGSSIVQQKI